MNMNRLLAIGLAALIAPASLYARIKFRSPLAKITPASPLNTYILYGNRKLSSLRGRRFHLVDHKRCNAAKGLEFTREYYCQQLVNGIAALDAAEIEGLLGSSIYHRLIDGSEKEENFSQDQVNWAARILYNAVRAGRTDIADVVISDDADIHALLLDALSPLSRRVSEVSEKWLDWLVARGADVNEAIVNKQLWKLGVIFEDIELLDYLREQGKALTEEQLNALLALGLEHEAIYSARWLLIHGADQQASSKIEELIVKNYLLSFFDGGEADFVAYLNNPDLMRDVTKDTLNTVLREGMDLELLGSEGGEGEFLAVFDKLLELDAQLSSQELNEILYESLDKRWVNWKLVNWTIKHGADINQLDMNELILERIGSQKSYDIVAAAGNDPTPITAAGVLFDFLVDNDLDRDKLDLPRLLGKAEAENTEAIAARLLALGSEQ